MARFLSPEWLSLLATAAASSGARDQGPGGPAPLAIRQLVTGGPDGDVEYVVRADAGRYTVHLGGEVEADVDVIQDYDTAVAISQGALSAAVAFAGGRLKLGGGVGRLAGQQETFADLGKLFAQVRDATTY